MATLERIRRRSGLLIIVIGLAMAAFILTDLLGSGGMLFTDYNSVGEINGKKITREEFAIRMEKLVQSNHSTATSAQKCRQTLCGIKYCVKNCLARNTTSWACQ
jgi:peptidyl-prolyl cis-trans isomerase D